MSRLFTLKSVAVFLISTSVSDRRARFHHEINAGRGVLVWTHAGNTRHRRNWFPDESLAVAYAISDNGFACETLPARIDTLPDDVTEPGVQGVKVDRKPYLLASNALAGASAQVTYCASAPDGFKDDLMRRLTR